MNPGSLSGRFATAEAIAAKDLNNLYLTSCYFEDRERYKAFCALYAVMRVVDDRIDSIPSRSRLSAAERQVEHDVVDGWQELLTQAIEDPARPLAAAASRCDFAQAEELLAAAGEAMVLFPLPISLWHNFFAAMHLDIDQHRFASYDEFLGYAEGATVAPTTIYLYLIAATLDDEQRYRLPSGFDLIACGRQLGLFAYLAHILRDLAFDLSTGDEGLLYLAGDDMHSHGVNEEMLFADLKRRQAGAPVRALVAGLVSRAHDAAAEGRRLAKPLADRLSIDCTFILELIIAVYERVLGKIVDCEYDPLRGDHRLSMEEKAELVYRVAARVGMEPPALPQAPIG